MSDFMGAGGTGGQIMSGLGAAANNFNQSFKPTTGGPAGNSQDPYADLRALLEKYFPKKSEIDPNNVSVQGTRVDYNNF